MNKFILKKGKVIHKKITTRRSHGNPQTTESVAKTMGFFVQNDRGDRLSRTVPT